MWLIHYPICSKSCQVLNTMEFQGEKYELINLQNFKPSREFIENLIEKLSGDYFLLIRTNESYFVKHFDNQILSKEKVIELLIQHPELMQRPILFDDKKAMIIRPIEKLNEFLK